MASNSVLTGSGSSLSYVGVRSPQPPNFVAFNRAPVSGTANVDIKNFNLGDIWLNTATDIPYILVDMSANVPTWSSFASSGGGASDFVTDSGTATEVGGSINVLGGDLLNTAGVGDTVTVNLDRGTDGQIIIAATGSASMYGSLTSTGGTITVTGGANTLNVDTAGSVAIRFDGDSGMSTPALGIEKLIGAASGNITTAASSNQVTFAVSGTTDHTVQVGNSTGSLTSIGAGTTNQLLAGNTGADPSFKSNATLGLFTQVVSQVFTSSDTYTPTSGMKYCIVECVGGGAGGGGEDLTNAAQVGAAGGGGAGAYCRKVFDAATIGASQVVTIGAAGTGGAAGHNDGTNGGTTTFGALLTATGGEKGVSATVGPACAQDGGPGGSASGGDINVAGQPGRSSCGITNATSSFALGGTGGSNIYGAGGMGPGNVSGGAAGANANGYGAGGGGAACGISSTARAGGDGTAGIVIVTEFVAA